MNRTIGMGVAIFFAMLGIALLGGEREAVAGHGCAGVSSCCGVQAQRGKGCQGGLFARRRAARHCSGVVGCKGDVGCRGRRGGLFGRGCHGVSRCCGTAGKGHAHVVQKGGAMQKGGAAQKGGGAEQKGAVQQGGDGMVIPPAPPESASIRTPRLFYRLAFRR